MNANADMPRKAASALIAFFALVPFYLLVLVSLKGPEGGMATVGLVPEFHAANFAEAWNRSALGLAMLNSAAITVGAVALLVFLSGMAGYAIARVNSRLNRAIFYVFLFSMMIPGIINTVPLYTLLIRIRGINTHWAMIAVLAANALPFSVFLYASFIRGMPASMEEAAFIDGCSPARSYWLIIFPLLKPVTASVVILQGLGIWNNFAQAVFFLQNQKMRTVPLAISLFFQQYGANWPVMAAAALIGLAPAVAAFLAFQKFFIRGMVTGAIKG